MAEEGAEGWRIRVRGLVQGVGFRPTVWQVAHALGLTGSVRNTAAGVMIEIAGDAALLDLFLDRLRAALPVLARIDGLDTEALSGFTPPQDFRILESEGGRISASVVADAMLCEACAAEIRDPVNRRFGYPFTNCTHCGPRLSIIRAIPYDRANTAMADFPLCARCRCEYEDPADRRYHAEPVCCADCGPGLWLEGADGIDLPEGDPLDAAAALLRAGRIVAIKGLGGFHLACLAASDAAVSALRTRKRRPSKPLALMAADIATARSLATLTADEETALADRRGPILLLRRRADAPLSPFVAPRQDRIGVMLPTTPLHALLMDRVGAALVMTSANESGFPQCLANEEARDLLGTLADALVLHDRDIVARVDDSVVRRDPHGVTLIRRARGYAPEPFALPSALENGPSVFAAGADLKSAFAFSGEGAVTVSQYLGDLDNAETRAAWRSAAELYASIFERRPDVVAIDSHPGYVSATLGRAMAGHFGAEVIEIQHHHAHLASCLAENGWSGGPVLGVILDGTGFGEDGTIWGGEFLLGDYAGYRRVAHFPAVPLIGGDRAALEPWRNAYAHLVTALGPDFSKGEFAGLDCIQSLASRDGPALASIARSRTVSPLSSSAGRLFDAAAFVIGIAPERLDHEGQTGMELEALSGPFMAAAWKEPALQGTGLDSWLPLWRDLLSGVAKGQPQGLLAARFHRYLIDVVAAQAQTAGGAHGVTTAALSGGVFQNALLLTGVRSRLEARGFRVLTHAAVPANDGGIALGQAAIASALATGRTRTASA